MYGYRPYVRGGVNLGFSFGYTTPFWGLYAYPSYGYYGYGYPYRYPYGYAYNYPYSYPYRYNAPSSYPYAPAPGYVVADPGDAYGSVRLAVTPRYAAVHVDGYYVGTVDDFDGVFQHLDLPPGPHHIDISAPGCETLSFDVRIDSPQTITYRGDLRLAQP